MRRVALGSHWRFSRKISKIQGQKLFIQAQRLNAIWFLLLSGKTNTIWIKWRSFEIGDYFVAFFGSRSCLWLCKSLWILSISRPLTSLVKILALHSYLNDCRQRQYLVFSLLPYLMNLLPLWTKRIRPFSISNRAVTVKSESTKQKLHWIFYWTRIAHLSHCTHMQKFKEGKIQFDQIARTFYFKFS